MAAGVRASVAERCRRIMHQYSHCFEDHSWLLWSRLHFHIRLIEPHPSPRQAFLEIRVRRTITRKLGNQVTGKSVLRCRKRWQGFQSTRTWLGTGRLNYLPRYSRCSGVSGLRSPRLRQIRKTRDSLKMPDGIELQAEHIL